MGGGPGPPGSAMSRCSTVAPSVLLLRAVVGSTMPRLCSSINTSKGGPEPAGGSVTAASVGAATAAASPTVAAAPLIASAATAPATGAPAAAPAAPAAAASSSVFLAAELMMLTAPSTSDTKRKSRRMRGFCGNSGRGGGRQVRLGGGPAGCACPARHLPHAASQPWAAHTTHAQPARACCPDRRQQPTWTSRLRRGPQRRASTYVVKAASREQHSSPPCGTSTRLRGQAWVGWRGTEVCAQCGVAEQAGAACAPGLATPTATFRALTCAPPAPAGRAPPRRGWTRPDAGARHGGLHGSGSRQRGRGSSKADALLPDGGQAGAAPLCRQQAAPGAGKRQAGTAPTVEARDGPLVHADPALVQLDAHQVTRLHPEQHVDAHNADGDLCQRGQDACA